jgi:hypothetical protein
VEELMGTNLLLKVLGDERQKGIEQGVQQGRAVGVQQAIERTLRRRFGEVPDAMLQQVRGISDPDRLALLLDAAIDAHVLDEFAGALNS